MNKVFMIITIGFFIILGGGAFFSYQNYLGNQQQKNDKIISQLNKAKNILKEQKSLPRPSGETIFYKKSGEIIKNPQEYDYDIVSGWLCGPNFKKLGIDFKEPYHKKCYRYSKYQSSKKFQIGGVIKKGGKNISIIKGNTENNIIKDYINDNLVKNKDTENFPYNPETRFITANFQDLSLGKNGFIKVITNKGKVKKINKNNFKNISLKPFYTIISRGEDTKATIKFENQDILKISGRSVLKLKANEIFSKNDNKSIFWLLGNISYHLYNGSNGEISTPSGSLGIRGDILRGKSDIKDNKYNMSFEMKGKNEKVSKENTYKINYDSQKIENLFKEKKSNTKADILQTSNKVDIENIVKVKK